MSRSRYGSLSAFAAVALAATASFATTAVSSIVRGVHSIAELLCKWAFSGLENLHQVPAGEVSQRQPEIRRVSARAFMARLMRRARPQVTPGWRMCPSV